MSGLVPVKTDIEYSAVSPDSTTRAPSSSLAATIKCPCSSGGVNPRAAGGGPADHAVAYRSAGRGGRSLINHKQKVAITHGRVPRWFYSTFIIKHTILFRGNGLLLALLLIAGLHFSSIVLNDLEMAFKFKSDRYLHSSDSSTSSQELFVLWILFNLYFIIAKCNWNVEEELLKYLDGNIFNSVRLNLKRYWTGHICYGIDNMDRHSECLVRAPVMPP